jgi:cell division protein FtsI/penicillin-binding protein 2
MLGRTDSRRRLLLLLVAFVVAAGALFVRLGQWQVLERGRLAAQAEEQTTIRAETPARRGTIYDRSGTVVLATTIDHYRLAASPNQLTRVRRLEVAEELVELLDLDDERARTLTERMLDERAYVVLARDIDEATAQRIRDAEAADRIAAVALEEEPVRVYPQPGGAPDTSLAAHLLGFVNREGEGQYGVEQRYQDVLGGLPRVTVARRDANGGPIPDTTRVVDPGVPGEDVRLTIDASLQLAIEQEVLATQLADEARKVSAVVMDPITGEVLASATYPSYDGNAYREVATASPERFVDPVVSEVYEPGSVFKMLTAVAALDRGTVGLKTKVNDSGRLKLDNGKTQVEDADGRAMGWLTFEDIVAYSRNVGVARVALEFGETTRESAVVLHDTWRRFGFGSPTGIDVAGEVGGIVRDPTIVPWRQIDLANGTFGQGVAVTPIQLATAFSAMVNGGTLVQPHAVLGVGDRDVVPTARATGLITPELSSDLAGLMAHVVTEVDFYRDRTLVPGYLVGGKTGTAQIWDPTADEGRGAWKRNLFNYSFVGFIGRGQPELVVAVRIEEARPSVVRRGFIELPVMSFELFRRVATNAMSILDLPDPRALPTELGPADGWSEDGVVSATDAGPTDAAPADAVSP